MEPQQALAVIKEVIGGIPLTLPQHGQIQQVLAEPFQVLAIAIAPHIDPEGKPVPPGKAKKKPKTPKT